MIMLMPTFAPIIYCIVLATFIFSFVAPFFLERNPLTAPLAALLDSTRDWLMQGATTFCFIFGMAELAVMFVMSLVLGTNQWLTRAPKSTSTPAALERGTAPTRGSGAASPPQTTKFELRTANKVIWVLSCIALICYEFDRQDVVSREKPLRDNAALALRFLLEGIQGMNLLVYLLALPMLFDWLRVRSTASAARRVEPVSESGETAQPGYSLSDRAQEAAGTNEKLREDGKENYIWSHEQRWGGRVISIIIAIFESKAGSRRSRSVRRRMTHGPNFFLRIPVVYVASMDLQLEPLQAHGTRQHAVGNGTAVMPPLGGSPPLDGLSLEKKFFPSPCACVKSRQNRFKLRRPVTNPDKNWLAGEIFENIPSGEPGTKIFVIDKIQIRKITRQMGHLAEQAFDLVLNAAYGSEPERRTRRSVRSGSRTLGARRRNNASLKQYSSLTKMSNSDSDGDTESMADLYYTANSALRPALATAAPSQLRNVLNLTKSQLDWPYVCGLVRKVIESQVQAHDAYIAERVHIDPSFEEAAAAMPEDPGKLTLDDMGKIPQHLRTKIPYPAFRRLHTLASESTEPQAKRRKGKEGAVTQSAAFAGDIDEWILTYEKFLGDTRHHATNWKHGLVSLKDADAVFPDSALSNRARTIHRPQSLSGFLLLGEQRQPHVQIQPSVAAFKSRFDRMSGGLLEGLDWSNILVAGGIVLGALLAVDAAGSDEQWESSDIDMYVYGLDSPAATKKIEEIFRVYRANLPQGAPTLVVRNSKTITFYSNFPVRRIQIVLKLVKSPKDVLLNFDLDICAMGWDGSDLWMLPRAARALETGFNVFTMNLIQGHYLSERRASQEQRVFKYAKRGYGIRILPSYLESLPDSQNNIKFIARGEHLFALDIAKIANASRRWTANVISALHGKERPVHCSHLDLENGDQHSTEPQGQSCLSGFSLFMRHVALWEMERRGEVMIKDQIWAVSSYRADLSYDDTPRYEWDSHFNLQEFISHIDSFNKVQLTNWLDTCRGDENEFGDIELNPQGHYPVPTEDLPPKLVNLQRLSYAPDPKGILDQANDITMAVLLPANFAAFANDLVCKAQNDAEVPGLADRILAPVSSDPKAFDADEGDATLRLYIWRISAALMWQQLDRRIDEVFEVLFAFYRIHDRLDRGERTMETPQIRLCTQLSKRVIRTLVEDELAAFARWVGRKPIFVAWFYKGGFDNLVDGVPEKEKSIPATFR
ncbi:hypothetical protein GGX14DRAFT_588656 [Mycena pura]|uniref:Uncharacterized protein n=1 Tax=Mycena pura TaxID=153505 RepID=A0AAD6UVS8_9AGAR|nr:hypothetical protein GGX14DRAFT_588656 [Mycena pura]